MTTTDRILNTSFGRRWFYGTASATLLALVLLRLYVLPSSSPKWNIGDQIIDAVIAAIATAVIVTVFIQVFLPPQDQAGIEVIEPWRIEETLATARAGTREWWYRGHTGRHFRSVTLPELIRDSQKLNQSKDICLMILNPTDDIVCQRYANYRTSLRSAKADRPWTADRVRLELDATIVTTIIMAASTSLLSARVAVINCVSTLRIDQSDSMAILTKEDPREPALRIDRSNHLFGSYREDLKISFDQYLQLRPIFSAPPLTELTTGGILRILKDSGLGDQDLSETSLVEVLKLVKNPRNPYV